MLVVFIRTIILYILVVIIMRLMGKRQIGELQPFEFTIALLIADLAAVPMGDIGTPLFYGVIPIITLLVLQILLSYCTMKSPFVRRIVCGKPSIMVHKGAICEKTLKSQRYNLNDLLEQLRSAGYFDVADVEYAILETGGMLTVIPKETRRPVTPADLSMTPAQEDIPINVIMDGKLNQENIRRFNIDINPILNTLKNAGFRSYKEVLLLTLSNGNELFIQGKQPRPLVIHTTLR